MGDIVGINGQEPGKVMEDQKFDNFIGFCLIPLICKWCGGIDEEMAEFCGQDVIDGIRMAYECSDDQLGEEGENYLLESTDDIRRLKDLLRETMLKFKNEMEDIF